MTQEAFKFRSTGVTKSSPHSLKENNVLLTAGAGRASAGQSNCQASGRSNVGSQPRVEFLADSSRQF